MSAVIVFIQPLFWIIVGKRVPTQRRYYLPIFHVLQKPFPLSQSQWRKARLRPTASCLAARKPLSHFQWNWASCLLLLLRRAVFYCHSTLPRPSITTEAIFVHQFFAQNSFSLFRVVQRFHATSLSFEIPMKCTLPARHFTPTLCDFIIR